MTNVTNEILIKALELQEQGQTPEQICAALPSAAGELRQFFALAADLRAEAGRIAPPPRELLRGALRRAAAAHAAMPIAKPALARFFGQVPLAVRLLAPAFAVALIAFFASRSPAIAPEEGLDMAAATPSDTQMLQAVPASAPAPAPAPARTAAVPEAMSATPQADPTLQADAIVSALLAAAAEEEANFSD